MGREGIKEKKALVIAAVSDFLAVLESGKKECILCGRSICKTNFQGSFCGDFRTYGVDSFFGSGMQCFAAAAGGSVCGDSICGTYGQKEGGTL
jgi:hypothetical protein